MKRNNETHGGVLCVSDSLWREVIGDVLTVNSVDMQGVLRDKGVFAEVHKRLLLPETYIVHNIFYKWMLRQWNIVVEGPDLPLAIEGVELTQVTPIYQRNEDGSAKLLRIEH